VALYSKYECAGQMAVMDQEVKNVKFALMGNFSLWKAFTRLKIPTVQYIIRSSIFSFESSVCVLNKLNYVVNSLSFIALPNISSALCQGSNYKSRLLILIESLNF
jgi:hypothetical protein